MTMPATVRTSTPHEFGSPRVAALRHELRAVLALRDAFDAEIDATACDTDADSRRVDWCVGRSVDLDRYANRVRRALAAVVAATGEAVMP